MKITLERKINENDIGKENNIIEKNVNDNMDKKINANYLQNTNCYSLGNFTIMTRLHEANLSSFINFS